MEANQGENWTLRIVPAGWTWIGGQLGTVGFREFKEVLMLGQRNKLN